MTTRPLAALRVLAIAGTAALLGACSSTPSAPARTEPAPRASFAVDHDAWRSLGYRWEWTSRPPRLPGGVIEFVDAYEDLLVVQDSRAMVSVIEAPTGRIRWNKQVAETNTRFLGNARRNGSVVVTNETELFEFDLRTGNTLDRTPIQGIATTKPVFYGRLAVLGTAAGRLIALDTDNNIRVWEYQFDGQVESPPLRLDDERVAAISTRGQVRSLFIDGPRTQSSGRISGDSAEMMVSDGEFLFIGSLDQSVYGYDLNDGHRLWRLRSSRPVTVQPVLHNQVLYVTTADTGLAAIDAITGETLWSNQRLGGWVVATNDDTLIVWTGADLLSVDPARGDLISRTRLPDVAGIRADRLENGNLFAIARDGSIAKFSPR